MAHLVALGLVSQRRVCHLVGISRSVARRQSCRADETALRTRLRELAAAFPRYGYKLLHEFLKRERLVVNAKRRIDCIEPNTSKCGTRSGNGYPPVTGCRCRI